VNYMPVSTQLTFARTSHALRDMVYDDSRWVSKLKAMGVWNEEEARQAAEEEIQHRREEEQRRKDEAVLGRRVTNGTTTLFDATVETKKLDAIPVTPVKNTGDLMDFATDSPEAFGDFQSVSAESPVMKSVDTSSPLKVLSSVISRRGQARQEFEKVYRVLAPIYLELVRSNSLEDAPSFKQLKIPEEQAKLLHELERFGRSNSVDNWTRCQKRFAWVMETFERQCVTEFEEYGL
jgi:recyclin-1